MSDSGWSLQRRLLSLLFGVIAVVAAVQAGVTYWSALRQADQVFDQQMKQLALAFRAADLGATRVTGDGPGIEETSFLVQVWSADGRRVYQSGRRTVVPARREPGYSVARTGDHTYRVFSLTNRDRSIQISQDMQARNSQARAMALASALPIALLVPVLMLLTAWVVRRAMRPVEQARRDLAGRAAHDLNPIVVQDLPDEIRPMVSELNQLFERLDANLLAQKAFVGDAAHELRTPLTALKLQVRNLQRAALDADELQYGYALSRLEQGVQRATRLIDQLLSLARYQDSDTAVVSEGQADGEVDLEALARDAITALVPLATERQVDLGLASSEPLHVPGQADMLAVMLSNLIENAIKYAPQGGRADVSVVEQNGRPALIVEDDGQGIAPAQRERVFDRFYRADASSGQSVVSSGDAGNATAAAHSDGDVPGSGLGLAIVRSIVARHGADILLARSPRLGGLRVCVSFSASAQRAGSVTS